MKKYLCLILIFITLMAGCKTVEKSEAQPGYREALAFAKESLIPALDEKLNGLVSAYNGQSGETLAVSYYSFYDPYLPLTSGLCEDERVIAALQDAYTSLHSEASVIRRADNLYEISFSDDEKEVLLTCEYRPSDGAIQCLRYIDGEFEAFFDFVPLGGDRYAVCSSDTMAIVAYSGGEITSALYAKLKYSYTANEEIYDSDIRRLRYPEDSFFRAATIDESAIWDRKEDLMHISEWDGNSLRVSLCRPSYVFDENHTFVKREWEWQDDVTITGE
ncbi:MAG: hypothetical protein Q4C04_00985 [Clostridia bacterium]|nr:hypothetical protein [Clostridia bacterium]